MELLFVHDVFVALPERCFYSKKSSHHQTVQISIVSNVCSSIRLYSTLVEKKRARSENAATTCIVAKSEFKVLVDAKAGARAPCWITALARRGLLRRARLDRCKQRSSKNFANCNECALQEAASHFVVHSKFQPPL